MHLVTTLDGTINFLPRNAYESTGTASVTVYITNEDTRSTTALTETATIGNNLWTINPTYTFEEGGNYSFRVLLSGNEIYKGLIFCTNLSTNPFSYNDYTTYDGRDNEYIFR